MTRPLFHDGAPATAHRVAHLDLKGVPPTFSRLLELADLFKRMRFTGILMEWEDVFPWSCDPRLRAPHAYTPEEVRIFADHCGKLGLELVPLVQTLGHAENVLRLHGHHEMREVPRRTDVYHPLHPDAPGMARRMVADVLDLLPETRRFHLGGDEVYTLGEHPASREFIANHGIAALYMLQLDPALRLLEGKGIRPMLWHDEIVSWEPGQIRPFAERADLVVWGYTGDPRDPETYHHRLPHLEKLASLGCALWGATAYKGADGPWADLPDTRARAKATRGWVEAASRFNLRGLVCTGWSRYASGRVQVSPVEGALDSLLYSAVILYNGAPPESVEACRNWLDAQPECHSFRECRECLLRISRHVAKSWDWIRQLEEQLAHLEFEPHRAGSGIEETLLELLLEEVDHADRAGRDLESLLGGRVPSPLPRFYRQSRCLPLERAIERLRSHPAMTAANPAAPMLSAASPADESSPGPRLPL